MKEEFSAYLRRTGSGLLLLQNDSALVFGGREGAVVCGLRKNN